MVKTVDNDNSVNKKRKRNKHPIRKFFAFIGATFLSIILIFVITVSIIAAMFAVYILQYADQNAVDISLSNLDLDYTTRIYGYDKNGEIVELASISRGADRTPVTIDMIPQHVQDAFVYIEDERFYEHYGVDWTRTFMSFMNEILNMWSRQGGSTITQQLIKNVTNDNDVTWDRKMREIFRAATLEKYCPKTDILETYLNYIGFGGATSGIQAASQKYFGKDVSELTVAQGACLAAIPKNPEHNNPFAYYIDDQTGLPVYYGYENNRERQIDVLNAMYKNAVISKVELEAALEEDVKFLDPNAKYEDDEDNGVQSWFVDMVIREVTHEFMSLYGLDFYEANDKLYNGGYEIYTTIDIDMQEEVEAKYKDYKTFSDELLADPPQSAFIAMDYQGNVKAVVGAIGEKSGSNIHNHATMSARSPGSCIKPITSYSYGIEHNILNWSSVFVNEPVIDLIDEATGVERKWPYNYNKKYWDEQGYFTFQALQRSLNTIPAQLIQYEEPQNVFNFLQNKIHVSTLSAFDADLAPLSVGALTNGMYLEELVASYQIFGNGGNYFEPTSFTKVTDSSGKIIIQHKYIPIQVISKESSYIMNKLLQTVIEGPNGTGKAAKLDNTPLIGKTGTSQDWHDLAFVGCTPDYVSGVWYGYDIPKEIPTGTYYSSSQVWKNVFGDIADAGSSKSFPVAENVKEYYYCTVTGKLAGADCPTAELGYYNVHNLPEICSGDHEVTLADAGKIKFNPDFNTIPGLYKQEVIFGADGKPVPVITDEYGNILIAPEE